MTALSSTKMPLNMEYTDEAHIFSLSSYLFAIFLSILSLSAVSESKDTTVTLRIVFFLFHFLYCKFLLRNRRPSASFIYWIIMVISISKRSPKIC